MDQILSSISDWLPLIMGLVSYLIGSLIKGGFRKVTNWLHSKGHTEVAEVIEKGVEKVTNKEALDLLTSMGYKVVSKQETIQEAIKQLAGEYFISAPVAQTPVAEVSPVAEVKAVESTPVVSNTEKYIRQG